MLQRRHHGKSEGFASIWSYFLKDDTFNINYSNLLKFYFILNYVQVCISVCGYELALPGPGVIGGGELPKAGALQEQEALVTAEPLSRTLCGAHILVPVPGCC